MPADFGTHHRLNSSGFRTEVPVPDRRWRLQPDLGVRARDAAGANLHPKLGPLAGGILISPRLAPQMIGEDRYFKGACSTHLCVR